PPAPLVLPVRLGPFRVPLALAQRFLHVRLEPLRLERPGADERLVDEIRLVRVLEPRPPAHELCPVVRRPRERRYPRPHVARPLRVVRRRRAQMPREARLALEVAAVQVVDP